MTDQAAGTVESSAAPSTDQQAEEAIGSIADAPIEQPKKTKKFKINNREVDVDLSDEAKIDALISKGLGADDKFREASKLAQKYSKLSEWEKNPFFEVLSKGANPLELAEKLLLERIKWEELTPEQREFEETKKERDALKAEREAMSKKEKESRYAAETAKAAQEIDAEVTEALKAMGRKPTPRLIARIAETLIAEHENQIAPLLEEYGDIDAIPEEMFQAVKGLPASEAVGKVHKEYLNDIAEYLKDLPLDEMKKILPKEILDGLRKADVQSALSQDPVGSRKPRDVSQPTQKQPVKRMSTDEFIKNLEKRLG